jgi:ribosome maturation factor RimP
MNDLSNALAPLIEAHDAELYDAELVKEGKNTIFRVFIYKAQGVDVQLCAKVSRAISPLLDTMPPIDGEYTLEVSSPGIERRLRTLKHFALAIGENVKITLKDKKRLKGRLIGANKMIEVEGNEPIEFESIAKARVIFSQ